MLTSHTTKQGTPVSLVTRDKGIEDRLLGSIPVEIEDRWCMLLRNIRLRGSLYKYSHFRASDSKVVIT